MEDKKGDALERFGKIVEQITREVESSPDFLHYDFKGWPVKKITLKELLLAVGAIEKNGMIGFDADNPNLDTYPETVEEYERGNEVNEMFFSCGSVTKGKDGMDRILLWRDVKGKDLYE